MPLDVTVTLTGDPDRLSTTFRAVGAKLTDWRPAFTAIAAEYKAYEEHVFASEGAAHPKGKWKPLSPRYQHWKELHYPGRTIMTRTGALRAAAGSVQEMTPTTLVLGPGKTIPYAAAAGAIRPYIEPSPVVAAKMRAIALEYLKQVVAGVQP